MVKGRDSFRRELNGSVFIFIAKAFSKMRCMMRLKSSQCSFSGQIYAKFATVEIGNPLQNWSNLVDLISFDWVLEAGFFDIYFASNHLLNGSCCCC